MKVSNQLLMSFRDGHIMGQNVQSIHLILKTAHFLVAFLYKTTKAIDPNVATATFLRPYIVIELKCLATPVNPDPSAVMVELYSNCIDDKFSEMKQNFEGSKMSPNNSFGHACQP